VHQHDGDAQVGDQRQHGNVVASGGNVVDQSGPGVDRGGGHSRLRGVDAQHHPGKFAGDPVDYRTHALDLLGGGHGLGPGASGFTSDVDQVVPGVDHCPGLGDGGIDVGKAAAVGKAVGRDVQDAHDQRVAGGIVQPGFELIASQEITR